MVEPAVKALACLLVLSAGCDRVLLSDRPAPDAPCAISDDDEDGDCIANAVDNCPGITNTQQEAVLDNDPVGDACDPNRTDPSDRIFAFESFTVAAPWRDSSTDTPWMLGPGYARHTSTTDVSALFQRSDAVASSDVTVEAAFAFIAWAAGTPTTTPASTQLAVRVDGAQDKANGHSCRLDPISASDVELVLEDDSGQRVQQAVPGPLADQRIELRLQRTGVGRLRCELTTGDSPPVVLELVRRVADVWPATRHVGVDGPGVAVSLTHATIYVVD